MAQGTLPDIIRSELDRRGWSMRELTRRAAEVVEELSAIGIESRGQGVSISTISKWADRNDDREPDLKTLRILSIAIERPMSELIRSLKYDIGSTQALTDPRKRTLAMIEAAPDELLPLIDRLVELSPEHRDGVMAYIAMLEQKK